VTFSVVARVVLANGSLLASGKFMGAANGLWYSCREGRRRNPSTWRSTWSAPSNRSSQGV